MDIPRYRHGLRGIDAIAALTPQEHELLIAPLERRRAECLRPGHVPNMPAAAAFDEAIRSVAAGAIALRTELDLDITRPSALDGVLVQ